jgi:hypothetical protein
MRRQYNDVNNYSQKKPTSVGRCRLSSMSWLRPACLAGRCSELLGFGSGGGCRSWCSCTVSGYRRLDFFVGLGQRSGGHRSAGTASVAQAHCTSGLSIAAGLGMAASLAARGLCARSGSGLGTAGRNLTARIATTTILSTALASMRIRGSESHGDCHCTQTNEISH